MSLFNKFWNLRASFRAVFRDHDPAPAHAKAILDDLREFCRADTSCIVVGKDGRVDTHATAVAEGRREVYLRIMQTLNLPDEVLFKMKEQEDE